MRKKIPSLAALHTFEVAARLQSFTRTSEELALTQSAVCRQIAALEDSLGKALFTRVKKRVVITPAGRDYAQKIRNHLDAIERDTLEFMGQNEGSSTLELAVIPTFATQWLIPRLKEFQTLRPDIQVHLSTRTHAFLFDETHFHAVIHSGKSAWQGTQSDYLMQEEAAIPVTHPSLLENKLGKKKRLSLAELSQLPLLHLSTRKEDWRNFFIHHQHPADTDAVKGARYELFTMLIEAAAAGLGVALIPKTMIQTELETGKLIQVLPKSLPESASYFLVYPDQHQAYPPLNLFRDWLKSKT